MSQEKTNPVLSLLPAAAEEDPKVLELKKHESRLMKEVEEYENDRIPKLKKEIEKSKTSVKELRENFELGTVEVDEVVKAEDNLEHFEENLKSFTDELEAKYGALAKLKEKISDALLNARLKRIAMLNETLGKLLKTNESLFKSFEAVLDQIVRFRLAVIEESKLAGLQVAFPIQEPVLRKEFPAIKTIIQELTSDFDANKLGKAINQFDKYITDDLLPITPKVVVEKSKIGNSDMLGIKGTYKEKYY